MIEDLRTDENGDTIYIGFNPFVAREEHFARGDLYRGHGTMYGYPECCIDYFCATIFPGLSLEPDHWASGTGYIPCPSCRKKPKKEVIEVIDSRRCVNEDFTGEKS